MTDTAQAQQLAEHLQQHGSFMYNPHTGDVEPMDASESTPVHVMEIDAPPSATDIHHLLLASAPLMDGHNRVFAGTKDDRHIIGVARPSLAPDSDHTPQT
jgi:DNA polymerase IIIc chi subunit